MEERRPSVDFVVESPDHKVRLLVEAKNAPAPSAEWAGRFLRNLFIHAAIPEADFFLLATRDQFFLWKHPKAQAESSPDFQASTPQVLAPYLSNVRTPLSAMSGQSFELLIQAWLTDLVGESGSAQSSEWIVDSGLGKAIRNGIIRPQLAA